MHTTQFEIRKPEVGLFEPVLRVTKEEMDAYEARTGKTLVRVAGACGEAEQACAEARTAKALGFDAVLLSPGGWRTGRRRSWWNAPMRWRQRCP